MQTDQTTVDTQSIAACLAEQADVVVGYLFGSVARGQATAQSDVDIAVLLDAAPAGPELNGHPTATIALSEERGDFDRYAEAIVRYLEDAT